ncbi:MAG TPA: hypothetical protein VLA35_02875 [Thermoleophilia bacterium]|nr:hypothetical protein [Thermoleophilia bacterium]
MRRTRRRRDRSRAFALLAATALLLLLSSASALAWFTATTSGSVTITTGVWADYLAFSPGGSRAIHWPDCGPTQLLPVAAVDDEGEISLDFGDVLAGTRRYWHDVLRVTSTAAEPLRLTFAVDGPAAPYIAQVRLVKGGSGDLLDPGATRSLAVRLVAPAGAAPGVYTGTLSVTVVGATERHDFPLTLSVLCERPRPSPSPSCTDQPSPDAAPTPDESPSEAPSASPAPSPDPSASPSPSPSPSGPGDASPSPEPSPSPPPDTPSVLFTLSAGSATVLPSSSPAGVPVAQVVSGGALHLDFGELPAGEPVVFADVARVSSSVEEPISVTLSLSGPIGGVVRSVGFTDGAGSIVGSGLSVAPGETERLAFGFDLGSGTAAGLYQGALTVTAELGDGAVQRCQVPVAATVLEAEDASEADADATQATALTLWLHRLWPLVQRPSGSPWRPVLLLVTPMR